MEFVRKNAQDLHKNIYKVQGTDVQTNIVVSRSDCHDEDREFLVDSGASLHMMSKNALTSETIRKSEEPTVIMTANGKAKSTEEATVHVGDLDVFVTMMLFDDSFAVLSLCLLCEEMEMLQKIGKREILG